MKAVDLIDLCEIDNEPMMVHIVKGGLMILVYILIGMEVLKLSAGHLDKSWLLVLGMI